MRQTLLYIISVGLSIGLLVSLSFGQTVVPSSDLSNAGPLVHGLWLMQAEWDRKQYGIDADERVKSVLAKALAGDGTIQYEEVAGVIERARFVAIAEGRNQMDANELRAAVQERIPKTRERLNAQLVNYLDLLTTSFDQVDRRYEEASSKLSGWIAKNYRDDLDLHVIVVCTGNSRRSILGASLGNAAAAYYGLDRLRFHSGGTAPTAFNSRTISALTEVGFQINATGEQAARGDSKTANPVYNISWGKEYESREFSKVYSDSVNPRQRFAAIMVCNEADAECPIVAGAELRLSMPFQDPKMFDGSAFEKAKYAERRDDIGRTLLLALCQSRQELRNLKRPDYTPR